jgi:hypothetical protein
MKGNENTALADAQPSTFSDMILLFRKLLINPFRYWTAI